MSIKRRKTKKSKARVVKSKKSKTKEKARKAANKRSKRNVSKKSSKPREKDNHMSTSKKPSRHVKGNPKSASNKSLTNKQQNSQCTSKKSSKQETTPKSTKKSTVQKLKVPCKKYEEFHDHFLNYENIQSFLSKTKKNHPESVDLVTIGYSGQGNPIYMVAIATASSFSDDPKFSTFIEAGLNGEDTFAVSNAIYMIDYLPKHPNYLCIMDYLIVPCANPDAYIKFIKSNNTVENKKPCAVVKRASKSNCNVGAKKPRLQSPKSENLKPTVNTRFASCKIKSKSPSNSTSCLFKPRMSASGNPGGSLSIRESHTMRRSTSVKTGDVWYNSTELPGHDTRDKEIPCKPNRKPSCSENSKQNKKNENTKESNKKKVEDKDSTFRMNLSLNFPVVLGLNDMRKIPTKNFLEKINSWKENYVSTSPEALALMRAINSRLVGIKLLISLQEGGESICYPYGFCPSINIDNEHLKQVARNGKNAISERNFQFGSTYDINGLTYGNLIDFLRVDKGSIKFTYNIQVHKKTPKYNEKQELKQLMVYGGEIMECIKRMSTAVFKYYTVMTGNKIVETANTKRGLEKKSSL